MIGIVLLVAFAGAVLLAFGLAVLAPLTQPTRDKLLPAAPVLGIALLVVVLHDTSVVVAGRVGVAVAVAVAAILVGLGVRRGTRPWRFSRTAVVWTAAGVLAGALPAVLALYPSLVVGDSGIVSPNTNNDAFYYVAVSDWLAERPATDLPDIGTAPGTGDALPVDGPARTALTVPLRVGQELVQGALNVLSATSSADTFSPWLATWVILLPGACVGAAGLLGWRRGSGLVLGVLMSSSIVVIQQVYTQNAASVLGIVLAPVVLACVIVAVDPQRRGSLLLGAVLLAALVGSYPEFGPIVGPAVLGAALARRTLPRALGLVALAVVLAPLAWWRAIGFVTGGVESGFDALPSPFLDAEAHVILNRLVGVAPVIGGEQVSVLMPLLAGLLAIGGIAALARSPDRGAWWGIVLGGGALVFLLSVREQGYTQRRAVEILVPLLLLVAVAGWDELLTRLPRRTAANTTVRRPALLAPALVPAVVVCGLMAATGLWAAVNARSARAALDAVDVEARHVDDSFAEAAAWVGELGGTDGEQVSTLVPDFFEQLWVSRALAEHPGVSYPGLFPDYLRVGRFWAGEVDRYLLVGRGTQVDAASGVVVRSNERFRLLDLEAGAALVVTPVAMTRWQPDAEASGAMSTIDDGVVLALRTAGTPDRLGLSLRVVDSPPLPVLVVAGAEQARAEVDAEPEWLEVGLPACCEPAMITVDADLPPAGGAGRDLSIRIEGVRRE